MAESSRRPRRREFARCLSNKSRHSRRCRRWKRSKWITRTSRTSRLESGERRMSNRHFGVAASGAAGVLLLLASMSFGQADQTANAEKQKAATKQQEGAPKKENAGDAIAALMGGPPIDKEAAERGRKIFVPTCGFCHGNDAHVKSGPEL